MAKATSRAREAAAKETAEQEASRTAAATAATAVVAGDEPPAIDENPQSVGAPGAGPPLADPLGGSTGAAEGGSPQAEAADGGGHMSDRTEDASLSDEQRQSPPSPTPEAETSLVDIAPGPGATPRLLRRNAAAAATAAAPSGDASEIPLPPAAATLAIPAAATVTINPSEVPFELRPLAAAVKELMAAVQLVMEVVKVNLVQHLQVVHRRGGAGDGFDVQSLEQEPRQQHPQHSATMTRTGPQEIRIWICRIWAVALQLADEAAPGVANSLATPVSASGEPAKMADAVAKQLEALVGTVGRWMQEEPARRQQKLLQEHATRESKAAQQQQHQQQQQQQQQHQQHHETVRQPQYLQQRQDQYSERMQTMQQQQQPDHVSAGPLRPPEEAARYLIATHQYPQNLLLNLGSHQLGPLHALIAASSLGPVEATRFISLVASNGLPSAVYDMSLSHGQGWMAQVAPAGQSFQAPRQQQGAACGGEQTLTSVAAPAGFPQLPPH